MNIDSKDLMNLRTSVDAGQTKVVSLVKRLVAIESPSGDQEGSRATNDLLESLARTIPSVSSIDRIVSPNCGEAAALNVPVLDGLGVDGDGAHAAYEHILLSDIAPRTALLAGLIASL
jgi:acetylornithine deacetylase/succinyl-diaminopimelate desuccinylase-like protein